MEFPFSFKRPENNTEKLRQKSTAEEENSSEQQTVSLEVILNDDDGIVELVVNVSQYNTKVLRQQKKDLIEKEILLLRRSTAS